MAHNITNLTDTSGEPFRVVYQAPRGMVRWQESMMRFRSPGNITKVLEEMTFEAAKQYVLGLIFLGCIILGFFLAWGTCLILFKCAGPKRVGFLSGAAFVRRGDNEEEEKNSSLKRRRRTTFVGVSRQTTSQTAPDDNEQGNKDKEVLPYFDQDVLADSTSSRDSNELTIEIPDQTEHSGHNAQKSTTTTYISTNPITFSLQAAKILCDSAVSVFVVKVPSEVTEAERDEDNHGQKASPTLSLATAKDDGCGHKDRGTNTLPCSTNTLPCSSYCPERTTKEDSVSTGMSKGSSAGSTKSEKFRRREMFLVSEPSSFKAPREFLEESQQEMMIQQDEPVQQPAECVNAVGLLDHFLYLAGDSACSMPSVARLIFLISGTICIIFGCLMATQGITNLQTSFDTVDLRANDMIALAGIGGTIIRQGLLDLVDRAEDVRTIVTEELGDEVFCPAFPDFINEIVTQEVSAAKIQLLEALDIIEGFRQGELKEVKETLDMIYNGVQQLAEQTGSYNVLGWESLIVIIPYTFFPSLLMLAAVLAFFHVSWEWYSCFVNWFVLPIFISMTVVAFTCAAAMSITAGVNSDFCLPGGYSDGKPNGNPDDIVFSALRIFGFDENTYTYQVASFYISQCLATDPFAHIRDYETRLEEAFAQISVFDTITIDEDLMAELSAFCNRDYDSLEPLLVAMYDIAEILALTVAQALDIAKCSRVIPLYTDPVYEAACQYTPKAVFWVFSCCLILAFFGMIMITLRSSMKMTVIDPSYQNKLSESMQFFKQKTHSCNFDHDKILDECFLVEDPEFLEDAEIVAADDGNVERVDVLELNDISQLTGNVGDDLFSAEDESQLSQDAAANCVESDHGGLNNRKFDSFRSGKALLSCSDHGSSLGYVRGRAATIVNGFSPETVVPEKPVN